LPLFLSLAEDYHAFLVPEQDRTSNSVLHINLNEIKTIIKISAFRFSFGSICFPESLINIQIYNHLTLLFFSVVQKCFRKFLLTNCKRSGFAFVRIRTGNDLVSRSQIRIFYFGSESSSCSTKTYKYLFKMY